MKVRNLIPRKNGESGEVAASRWESPFFSLQTSMNDLFEDFFEGFDPEPFHAYGKATAGFAPKLEVTESEKEFTISAELPGLDEKDIEVTLEGDVLTVKGEKKEEHEEKKLGYYRSERSYGAFQRSVVLPETISTGDVRAEVKKGVLKILLPKKPEAQIAHKKIEVKGE